ncbi:MAG: hypothetical protein LBP76_00870 [Treponema sp.]|jgi:hypothetical protein|nr:hypothetical protein [Treponema sp.]
MNKSLFVPFPCLPALFCIILSACANPPDTYNDVEPDQSVLLITRTKSITDMLSGKIDIFIDGRLERNLGKKETARIIIQNGEHTLHAKSRLLESDTITFEAFSSRVSLEVSFSLGYISLAKTGETALASLIPGDAAKDAGDGNEARPVKTPLERAISRPRGT